MTPQEIQAALLERVNGMGLSYADLSRRTGIDQSNLWKLLNSDRDFTAGTLLRLCGALGVVVQFRVIGDVG